MVEEETIWQVAIMNQYFAYKGKDAACSISSILLLCVWTIIDPLSGQNMRSASSLASASVHHSSSLHPRSIYEAGIKVLESIPRYKSELSRLQWGSQEAASPSFPKQEAKQRLMRLEPALSALCVGFPNSVNLSHQLIQLRKRQGRERNRTL
jgi:hypothetical protein